MPVGWQLQRSAKAFLFLFLLRKKGSYNKLYIRKNSLPKLLCFNYNPSLCISLIEGEQTNPKPVQRERIHVIPLCSNFINAISFTPKQSACTLQGRLFQKVSKAN